MRILIAALLGAMAMFVWTAVVHMATPLASVGFSQIPNEAQVMGDVQTGVVKPGLYIFPWVDPKTPKAMQKMQALEKIHGRGYLVYSPASTGDADRMGQMLTGEFLKQFVQAAAATLLVSLIIGLSYWGRVGAVTLTGVIAGIATNVSYWNWYGYPLDYTVVQVAIEIASAFFSGLAISWWLGRRTA
jgi:hypothetical protein